MSLFHQLQQQLHLLVVPMVVWVAGQMVHFVPWHPSSLSNRVGQEVLWEEALSMDHLPSTALPRAPHFFHKDLASLDQVLPPWVSANPHPPPLVPHWGPHWEDLELQVKFINPHTCMKPKSSILLSCLQLVYYWRVSPSSGEFEWWQRFQTRLSDRQQWAIQTHTV